MFRRNAMLRQLDQDIRDHIERETLDNIGRGLSPEEARYAALRMFGNIQIIKERTREVWVWTVLEQILQDLGFGARMLRRDPGFAVVAILTLAIGIGVNTAVFSVVNTVLLRPLPYPNADRIVAFSDGIAASSSEHFKPGIAGTDFGEWKAHAASFEALAGYFYEDRSISAGNSADRVRVVSIAGDFWALTGGHAALGRLFAPGESQSSVVLSHSLFLRRFNGDRTITGKVIELDGRPLTVTGILPQGFRFFFPQNWWSGLATAEPGAYVSAPPLLRAKPSRLFVAGRLKPRTSISSALTELRGIESAILKSYPDRWFPGISRMSLVPLETQLVGSNLWALLVLQAAGLFVLLIACANIANLLLARGAARVHEIAIRTAIGASTARILRQFLAEGIALALAAGVVGLLLALGMTTVLGNFGPEAIPRLRETSLDSRVLLFTIGLCLGSAILFGFGPALALFRENVQNALKQGAVTSLTGTASLSVRRLVVSFELALAIVLLTGAGLMAKSFWKMYSNPPGFAPNNTLVMKVALSGPQYADTSKQVVYFKRLLGSVASMPGVRSFGIANTEDYILQSAKSSAPAFVDQFRESLVSPGYFQAIGMQLLQGRWLVDTDAPDATIINETMARRAFGERNPLGERINGLGRPVRVIGVVANLKYTKLDANPGPEMFRLFSHNLWGGNATMTVAVRLAGDPLGLAPALRSTVSRIDPAQPVFDVESLEQALSASVATRRFELILFGLFAASALVMAVIGVYGVIAYSVAQRRREIGIRLALGAQPGAVVRMLVAQGVLIGFWGLAGGLAAAYGLTRLMVSLIFGVAPNDPMIFGHSGRCPCLDRGAGVLGSGV